MVHHPYCYIYMAGRDPRVLREDRRDEAMPHPVAGPRGPGRAHREVMRALNPEEFVSRLLI